jgi:uncharacterized protein YegP (UPF0339 family)
VITIVGESYNPLAPSGYKWSPFKIKLEQTNNRKNNTMVNIKFEVYKDKIGEWRWRCVHLNGNTLADCAEGYKNKSDCVTELSNIKMLAPMATIFYLEG